MTIMLSTGGWSPENWKDTLLKFDSERRIQIWPDDNDLDAARYLVAWKPDLSLLSHCKNLEVIFSLGAGVDHIVAEGGVPDVPIVRVVNDDLTARMVEWVSMCVLMHHRRFHDYAAQQQASSWVEHKQVIAKDMTVGIMGLGVLGQNCAELLLRLGFQVCGWSRSQKQVEGVRCFSGDEGLDEFLAATDHLVALLPHTAETDSILNYDLFSKLAQDKDRSAPTLINGGRGRLQNEEDIVRALDEGLLKAASLDVFRVEPLPKESALWQHPRVSVWPHVAAESDPNAIAEAVMKQINDYEAGKALQNLVDRQKGY